MAGNIFKYTFFTIFIFCGTKMLHLVKQSNENYTSFNPKMLTDDSHNSKATVETTDLLPNARYDVEEKEENEIGEKIRNADSMKLIKKTNSTSSANGLQRKRKLLSQMWDTYYKVRANTSFRINDGKNFHPVGSDIFAYSAFYDDRDTKDNENPMVRVITISKLYSNANLQCKFSVTRAGQWVQATKHELSDNHDKLYGGVMYICNVPHNTRNKPPKTVYLQSVLIYGDNFSKVTSKLVTVEAIPLEMSIWKSTIYQNADNLKNSPTEEWQANGAKYFLETFPNESDLKKYQTTDKSQAAMATDQGRQPDSKIDLSHQELPRVLPRISICVPPLFGDIKLSEFIQFVEIHKILGVSHFYFYKMNVSSDIERMLEYYKSHGIITVIDWQLPAVIQENSMNLWYNGQSSAGQDCLFRNIGKFDYTAFIDIDEVIVPQVDSDLPKMLERLYRGNKKDENTNTAAYVFKSGFFETDFKLNETAKSTKHHKLSFLRNIYRNEIVSSVRTKVIVKPEFIDQVGIHHVSKLLYSVNNLNIVNVPVKTALVHHYRKCTTAMDTEMHCGENVADASLLQYTEQLVKNYEIALKNNVNYFQSIR